MQAAAILTLVAVRRVLALLSGFWRASPPEAGLDARFVRASAAISVAGKAGPSRLASQKLITLLGCSGTANTAVGRRLQEDQEWISSSWFRVGWLPSVGSKAYHQGSTSWFPGYGA